MQSIRFIGKIHSSIKNIGDCPLQENEGAPAVSLIIHKRYREALSGLAAGNKIFLFTWLHKAKRNVLRTRPRNNPKAPLTGVFTTRSPDRPNPIGIHVTEIVAITNTGKITLSNLEVVDGTPVIDIKPYL